MWWSFRIQHEKFQHLTFLQQILAIFLLVLFVATFGYAVSHLSNLPLHLFDTASASASGTEDSKDYIKKGPHFHGKIQTETVCFFLFWTFSFKFNFQNPKITIYKPALLRLIITCNHLQGHIKLQIMTGAPGLESK